MSHKQETFNTQTITRFGRMLVNRNDVYIGQSILTYGEYSWVEIMILEQLLQPDSIIVEAGSNIGSHTVPLAQRVAKGGHVYAFEPQRLVFQTLCANVALNQCINVSCFWSGVGSASGTITIPEMNPYETRNFGSVSANQGGVVTPCATVDSLGLTRCALLKADVEGMEIDVLEGATETLARCRPILYMEADRKHLVPELIRKVWSLEYQLWWHFPPLFNPDNYFGQEENIFNIISLNLLCIPKELNMPVSGLTLVEDENYWPI